MKTRVATCLYLALMYAGCSSSNAVVTPGASRPCAAGTASAPASTAAVDDMEKMRRLQAEAEKLQTSKQTVKCSTLMTQLGRKTCKLTLPDVPARAVPDSDFYEKYKGDTLIVGALYKCDKCSRWHLSTACAFPVTADGVCVTNYHVFNEAKQEVMAVMNSEGRVFPVKEVLAASKDDDVAIIQVDGEGFEPLALGERSGVGSRVRLISHPNQQFYTMTEGVVSRYSVHRHGKGAGTLAMTITADFAKGSSGAPVLNNAGQVVGMVASTQSIYYNETKNHQENLQMVLKQCVPVESIRKLIEKP